MQKTIDGLVGKDLYFGNLLTNERQFEVGNFVGLALVVRGPKDIAHDAYDPLPVGTASVKKIQSQDVFEHLEYDRIPAILDEIFRVLEPGGIFRLSMPDYRSPLLKARSVFDECGRVIADLMMDTEVRYDLNTRARVANFKSDGSSHLWFPTYDQINTLIMRSEIRKCSRIDHHHYWSTDQEYVCKPFPDKGMPVFRAPPWDMRANGGPISIITDFIK
jgi:SAM-dependent methyltransferase